MGALSSSQAGALSWRVHGFGVLEAFRLNKGWMPLCFVRRTIGYRRNWARPCVDEGCDVRSRGAKLPHQNVRVTLQLHDRLILLHGRLTAEEFQSPVSSVFTSQVWCASMAPAPPAHSISILVVPKKKANGTLTTLGVLKKYVPENLKDTVAPKNQVRLYRTYIQKPVGASLNGNEVFFFYNSTSTVSNAAPDRRLAIFCLIDCGGESWVPRPLPTKIGARAGGPGGRARMDQAALCAVRGQTKFITFAPAPSCLERARPRQAGQRLPIYGCIITESMVEKNYPLRAHVTGLRPQKKTKTNQLASSLQVPRYVAMKEVLVIYPRLDGCRVGDDRHGNWQTSHCIRPGSRFILYCWACGLPVFVPRPQACYTGPKTMFTSFRGRSGPLLSGKRGSRLECVQGSSAGCWGDTCVCLIRQRAPFG